MRQWIAGIMVLMGLCLFVNKATAVETALSKMTLTSSATQSQGTMPVLYTCDGKDMNPQLAWQGAPDKTQAFALIMADPDAPSGTFYHWVLYNIPKGTTELTENIETLPAGTIAGTNSAGKAQYKGPCPPKGPIHHYIFTLYALDAPLQLADGADAKTVMAAVKGHTLEQAQFTAIFGR